MYRENRGHQISLVRRSNFEYTCKYTLYLIHYLCYFLYDKYFYFRRGSLLSTAIFVYAATSPVNGYFGGSLYARMGGKQFSLHLRV